MSNLRQILKKYTRGIARYPLVTLSQNTNYYFKKTLIRRHKLH